MIYVISYALYLESYCIFLRDDVSKIKLPPFLYVASKMVLTYPLPTPNHFVKKKYIDVMFRKIATSSSFCNADADREKIRNI